MNKVNSVFIILHYNEKTLIDTYECVDSIKNNINYSEKYKIIVVENGSNDNSSKFLKDKYSSDEDVIIVISTINLGFAKGNNLGCSTAIDLFNPKFLIVINNDTLITQKDFLNKITERYNKEMFHVMGPFIYDKNYNPQNPQKNLIVTYNELEKTLLETQNHLKKLEAIGKNNLLKLKYSISERIIKIIKHNKNIEKYLRIILNKKNKSNPPIKDELKNVGLHGSALIFTSDYYEKYPEVFYSKTFMYVEEDILFYRILNDNLTSIYYPEICIYHKEDKSTEATIIGSNDQSIFKLKNVINSLIIYKKIMMKNNN